MKLMKLMACAALAAACAVGFTGCSKNESKESSSSSKGEASGSEASNALKVADGTVFALVLRMPTDTALAPLIRKYKLNDVTSLSESAPPQAQALFKDLELDKIDVKWLLVTVGGELAEGTIPDFAFAAATTLNLDKVVAAWEKNCPPEEKLVVKKLTVAEVPAYELSSEGDKFAPCFASLDGKIIIGASSAAALEKQIVLYRDGKGASADFSSFGLAANDILHVKAVKVGEVVKKALPDPSMLQVVNGFIPDGDKLVLGLSAIELAATTDGKDIKLDLSVDTAADADAEKLVTVAGGGLAMATARAKKNAEKDENAAAALGALESAKTVKEGKIAKLSVTFPAELSIKSFFKYRSDSKRAACISNMRVIQTACEHYLLNHADKVPTMGDICGPDKYIRTEPLCPLGGKYKLSKEGGEIVVTCPHAGEGHILSH